VHALVPLPVVVPLLAAVLVVVMRRRLTPFAARSLSFAVAATVVGLAAALLAATHGGVHAYWFGGWTPRHGVPLGVSFSVDAFGALGALFAGVLVAAAVLVSARVAAFGPLAHALVLVLLAAAVGFCLTGDVFNLFVFFELMSVCTIALIALNTSDVRALRAALHFAVVNSIGAFLVLIGIALLYARTGALNLAEIGERLAAHPADQLVVTAFALIAVGFLTKAAIVPFHFWLVDAASSATPPVAMLLVGLLDTLGLYAIARIYWTVFSGPLAGHRALVQGVLLGAGALTAGLGAVLCVGQADRGRRLAFVSVSHTGIALVGLGLLNPLGLAGFGLYACADGATKAALFAVVRPSPRPGSPPDDRSPWYGGRVGAAVLVLAALALAGLPPGGTYLGKALIEAGVAGAARVLLDLGLLAVSIVTAAAVLQLLRGARGTADDPPGGPVALGAAAALVAGAFTVGLVPDLGARAVAAATRVADRAFYAAAVLGAHHVPAPHVAPPDLAAVPALLGLVAALGACLLVGRLGTATAGGRTSPRPAWLHRLHRAGIADSTAWLTVGTATIGAVLALGIR